MVSKLISFRASDELVTLLEANKADGESINLTAMRLLSEALGLDAVNCKDNKMLTDLIRLEVERALVAAKDELREYCGILARGNYGQLEELVKDVQDTFDDRYQFRKGRKPSTKKVKEIQ